MEEDPVALISSRAIGEKEITDKVFLEAGERNIPNEKDSSLNVEVPTGEKSVPTEVVSTQGNERETQEWRTNLVMGQHISPTSSQHNQAQDIAYQSEPAQLSDGVESSRNYRPHQDGNQNSKGESIQSNPEPTKPERKMKKKKKKKLRKVPVKVDDFWADIETVSEDNRSLESRKYTKSKRRNSRFGNRGTKPKSGEPTKGRVLESGDLSNSITSSHIAFRSARIDDKPANVDANNNLEIAKQLGVVGNCEEDLIRAKLNQMEVRDAEASGQPLLEQVRTTDGITGEGNLDQ